MHEAEATGNATQNAEVEANELKEKVEKLQQEVSEMAFRGRGRGNRRNRGRGRGPRGGRGNRGFQGGNQWHWQPRPPMIRGNNFHPRGNWNQRPWNPRPWNPNQAQAPMRPPFRPPFQPRQPWQQEAAQQEEMYGNYEYQGDNEYQMPED